MLYDSACSSRSIAGPLILSVLFLPLLSACVTQDEQPPLVVPRTLNSDAVAFPAPSIPAVPPSAADAEVPPGFRVEVVVSHLTYPTSVEFDDEGNFYIAEAGAAPGGSPAPARILRVSPAGQIDVMTDKLSPPVNDLLFHAGRLYVAQHGRICVLSPDGVLEDLAAGELLEHRDHNQLSLSPDGRIWVTQGSPPALPLLTTRPTSHTRPASPVPSVADAIPAAPARDGVTAGGALLSISADGRDVLLAKRLPQVPFGLAHAPDGTLFASFNRPSDADDTPDVIQPVDPPFDARRPDRLTTRLVLPGRAGLAKLAFPPARAAAAFGPPTTLYFAEFGDTPTMSSAFPSTRPVGDEVGGRLSRIDFSSANPVRETLLVARTSESAPPELGYRSPAGPRHPICARFSPDGGALYVIDFGLIRPSPNGPQALPETGVLWRITPLSASPPSAPANLSPAPVRHPPAPN